MLRWESKPRGRAQLPGAVLRHHRPQPHPVALPAGTLANKVKRKDTLAMKLGNTTAVQEEKFVFPRKSKEEWNQIRSQIGSTLTRYHKQRRVACEPSVRPEGWDWTKLVSSLSSLCWNTTVGWGSAAGSGLGGQVLLSPLRYKGWNFLLALSNIS